MPRQNAGITIGFWRTGLYTNRSQLFAPMRSMGINVVQMKDALIDGQDMEVTDHLEIQRRPGFTRFCSQQLAGGEIINQFASWRTSTGTVFPLLDSNQRFATFSTTAITTIWTKASADQAFSKMIGTQLYICNGTASGQKRYDTNTATLHSLGIPAPAAMPTITPKVVAGPTFWQPSITYAAVNVFLLDPNGNIQINSGLAGTTGTTPPIWNAILGSTTTDGTMVWTNLGPPGKWFPGIIVITQPSTIVDSKGHLQVANPGGTAGAAEPAWNVAIGGTTADGTITWNNFGSGTPLVFSGYTYVYTFSTQAPTVTTGYYHCSTASPFTFTTGTVFGTTYSFVINGAYTTNVDVGSIDIYRTKDGGSVLQYCGSVANNTAGGTWTFTDTVLDINLLTQTLVPLGLAHVNDPPPGSTGSVAPSTDKAGYVVFWQGRLWTIAGNKVYFSAGADCQNGDQNASWPPANLFTFPGQPIALTPTSAGLLVFLSDTVKIIAGGPQTLSFFAADLLENFGISSPNCVNKEGDTIRVLTTQGQQFTLTVSEKLEDGMFVADLIASNFPPQSSYLTVHRNGLDSGVYIGDGSTNILRYGLNINCWSPIYKPVGGIKALNSIETSTGVYTLCAGRASAAGFILGRQRGAYQDDSQNYSNCFTTVGNVVLSEPGQDLVPINYVVGYFSNVGTVPTISMLANEIDTTSGVGFITIPNPTEEPPKGAAPSTTLMAKRWSTSNQQTKVRSLLYHHVQVKIQFPSENAANTIKVLSLKTSEDDNG